MFNHLVCGSFQHQQDLELPCSSPKSKSKRKPNPYSSRGLDKFSTLLSELDQQRKKVYSQMNPRDISFVRFAYSNDNDFVPIVVKLKNNNQKKHKSEEQVKVRLRHVTSFSEPMDRKHVEETKKLHRLESSLRVDVDDKDKVVKKIERLKRPYCYVPVVMMLILLLLTVFGRSFATVCTCVVWYIVPILKESSKEKMVKKKDHVAEGLLSPTSGESDKRSGKHSHQKSW